MNSFFSNQESGQGEGPTPMKMDDRSSSEHIQQNTGDDVCTAAGAVVGGVVGGIGCHVFLPCCGVPGAVAGAGAGAYLGALCSSDESSAASNAISCRLP